MPAIKINKVLEGRPHIVDAIKNGEVQLVFNTTEGAHGLADSRSLRRAALLHKVPYYTTLSGAVAAAQGIKAYLGGDLEVRALQSYFGGQPTIRRSDRTAPSVGTAFRSRAGRLFGPRSEFVSLRLGGLRSDGQDSDDRGGLHRARGRNSSTASRSSARASSSRSPRRAPTAICRRTPNITPPRKRSRINEGRIAELEDKIARAEVIDVSKLSGDTIKFGATVTLIDEDTEKKQIWQIVGEPEADAKQGRISITSPLARALIGKKKGDTVEVDTPGGAKAYEINKVEWK